MSFAKSLPRLLKTFCGWFDEQLTDGTDLAGWADLHHLSG
jgi:hypothetical protein